jgi:poly-gamma-glutamate capsule biosynthesis protein CapA/YwtB (metallophosphatase superfamily)
MTIKLALAGDTMVGATAGGGLERLPTRSFFSPDLVEAAHEADFCILNLECCISTRGERWPAPGKPFFFRAPPRAVEILNYLGVDCVNLANNHSLDYGPQALFDTFEHLTNAGIRFVGAGPDLARARAPAVLERAGFRLAVLGVSDHPADFAAGPDRPGTALADFQNGAAPDWLIQALTDAGNVADAVLLTPHWGLNFTSEPPTHLRAAAKVLARHASLIAGHSAHVVHGVENNVLYDLGDFLETYPGQRASGGFLSRALHRGWGELKRAGTEAGPVLRGNGSSLAGNVVRGEPLVQRQMSRLRRLLREARAYRLRGDSSLLFLVTLDSGRPKRVEALPLKLTHSHTRLATGKEAAWIKRRFRRACRIHGTHVVEEHGRLVVTWQPPHL